MADQKIETESASGWKLSIEARMQRSDFYFDTVLKGQRRWYSEKAGQQKTRYLGFAITVIVLGSLISLVQIFSDQAWVTGVTAAMGAAVAILRALDTLLRPNETWLGYRKASEGMKREQRLYVTHADAYAQADDEEAAFRLLVERVEMVIAEEQQLFWQYHAKTKAVPEEKKTASQT